MAKRFYGKKSSSSMIKSGVGSHANMPQTVIMKDWPKMPYGLTSSIDDTITGIDRQLGNNNPSSQGVFKPKKY